MVKIRFFEKFKMAAILDWAIRPPGGMCTSVNQVFENLIPIPITMQKHRKGAARAELLWIRIQLIHDFHVFSKFGQNHIFGLYGKTRYFNQLHSIQNVLSRHANPDSGQTLRLPWSHPEIWGSNPETDQEILASNPEILRFMWHSLKCVNNGAITL